MVGSYYPEWIAAASVPLVAWLLLFAALKRKSRRGDHSISVNVPSIVGATLSFVSFCMNWAVVESGYDWSASLGFSIFLLFIYPFAVVTPLTGLVQAGVVLWVLGYMLEFDASMSFWSYAGYTIAWIATVMMCASVVWPIRTPYSDKAPDVWDRVLTMTFRSPSRSWLSDKDTVMLLFAIAFAAVGILGVITDASARAFAILLVGFGLIWYILETEGRARSAGPSLESKQAAKAKAAWIAFIALVYSGAVICVFTFAGSLSGGLSGEERTENLSAGLLLLAFVVPLAVWYHRKAEVPALPARLVHLSMAVFALFILLASILFTIHIRLMLSSYECTVFAGVALVLPMYLYVKSPENKAPGP